MDLRISALATQLVQHSLQLRPGEKVYIDYFGNSADALIQEIIRQVYDAKGIPFLHCTNSKLLREILLNCNEDQIALISDMALREMKQMDCYIRVKSDDNVSELADVPTEKAQIYNQLFYSIVHLKERVCNKKWVILNYPTANIAQSACMSTTAFEDFYFKVCTLDYSHLHAVMAPLQSLMAKTDKVRITGPGTDLTFSIKDIGAVSCYGRRNIPDGEVYSAPVKNSINGIISYNTPSVYNGYTFENISFEFKNGKIVKATANNTDLLNKILDSDDGARYIGEFSLGVNPFITTPMKNTLFDEKICGSFHLTPGSCYSATPNENNSIIHWDLVFIQTSDFGGGEIYFDGVLIRKNGIFVHPDLLNLNPENFVTSSED